MSQDLVRNFGWGVLIGSSISTLTMLVLYFLVWKDRKFIPIPMRDFLEITFQKASACGMILGLITVVGSIGYRGLSWYFQSL
jgi:hypothetical protein